LEEFSRDSGIPLALVRAGMPNISKVLFLLETAGSNFPPDTDRLFGRYSAICPGRTAILCSPAIRSGGISRLYGLSVAEIARINDISEAELLQVGVYLRISGRRRR
jgi:hypothetical protein